MTNADTEVDTLTVLIRELEARVKVLEDALRPFAEWAIRLDAFHVRGGFARPSDLRAIVIGDYDESAGGGEPGTVGDLRRAAKVMEGRT